MKVKKIFYGFLEGLVLTVQKLREAYPNAQIFICTPNVFKRVIFDRYPTCNGFNTLPQYARAIRQAADFLGCGVIDFANLMSASSYSFFVSNTVAVATAVPFDVIVSVPLPGSVTVRS